MSRGPTPIEAASSDELLERARDAMRNRAWDSPPGENVKELTAAALEKSPEDHRIRDLRDEAAEKILTEAVGKKYSGDRAEALRLAKLALELGSDHVAAQGLVAELDAPAAVASVPATAETGEPARTVAGPTKAGPGGARTSKTGLPPPARSNTSAVAPAGPSGKPKPTGTPSSTNAAQLPPAPPGGPWL